MAEQSTAKTQPTWDGLLADADLELHACNNSRLPACCTCCLDLILLPSGRICAAFSALLTSWKPCPSWELDVSHPRDLALTPKSAEISVFAIFSIRDDWLPLHPSETRNLCCLDAGRGQ